MSKVLQYVFILIALLIIVSYYTGFSTNVLNVGTQVRNIITTLQGRDPSTGNFENYPQ